MYTVQPLTKTGLVGPTLNVSFDRDVTTLNVLLYLDKQHDIICEAVLRGALCTVIIQIFAGAQ